MVSLKRSAKAKLLLSKLRVDTPIRLNNSLKTLRCF
jgi:hypothetical protein